MLEIQKERLGKREIIVTDTFPSLLELPRTYLGSFTWTNNKTRYMKKSAVTFIEGLPFTHSDIAVAYLTARYAEQRRRTSTGAYRECFCPKHKAVPLYAKPTKGELVYVDLKAAYWSMVLTGGWDVDYRRDKYIGIRSENSDFPFPRNKIARNVLVSIGLPRRVQVWTGKRVTSIKGRNPLYNGILWCFVQDVLHNVAADMMLAGCHYVHTDGYIFDRKDLPTALEIAESWGLTVGVKYEGYGEILGTSNYWIEGKPPRKPRPAQLAVKLSIYPTEGKSWLRTKIKSYINRRLYKPNGERFYY